uniref:Immunoglobulin C1-set domain-containing protein n=1 Tax=Ficedula albicollis TaxID=59894 RepID=A0A803V4W2_FICAL
VNPSPSQCHLSSSNCPRSPSQTCLSFSVNSQFILGPLPDRPTFFPSAPLVPLSPFPVSLSATPALSLTVPPHLILVRSHSIPVPPSLSISLWPSCSQPSPGCLLFSVMDFYPAKVQLRWFYGQQELSGHVAATDLVPNGDWTQQLLVLLETPPSAGLEVCNEVGCALKITGRVLLSPGGAGKGLGDGMGVLGSWRATGRGLWDPERDRRGFGGSCGTWEEIERSFWRA